MKLTASAYLQTVLKETVESVTANPDMYDMQIDTDAKEKDAVSADKSEKRYL